MAIYRVQRLFANGMGPLMSDMGAPKLGLSIPGAPAPAPPTAPVPFKPDATGANVESLENTKRIFKNGQNSVGLKQGALNTWNKMGKMGKAGVIGAGLLGTGLMAKGLLGGGSKEAAFSEDTGAALQEAAIYGTLGTGILGAGYLAKKGMLGKTGKKTYESASKKVKAIWNETNGKIKETATESKTVKKPGKPAQATIRTTTKETGKPTETTIKKVKFTPEQWSKVRKVIVEKGLDPRNPAHKLEAAKIAGVKPISVK